MNIEAKSLNNTDDFKTRVPAYFTLSAYYINRFNKNDPNTLIQSIPFASLKEEPTIIPGSNRCLSFTDKKTVIPMCLENDEQVNNIVESVKTLLKCRMGDNLKQIPTTEMKDIFNAGCNYH